MTTFDNALGLPLLTIILAVPLAGALACSWFEDVRAIRLTATVATLLDLALALLLLFEFHLRHAGTGSWVLQFSDRHSWVSSLGITYWLGVDGISVFLVGLTTLISAAAVVTSSFMIVDRVKLFAIFTLLLETSVLGVFTAANLFLFFVFWEAMLIPSYFLLGLWGENRRVYATTKFVVYTILGSFLMLVAIFYLWSQNGTLDMVGPHGLINHPASASAQTWLFLAFGIAFAIKMPIWPFHTWAPLAYTESPGPVVILISGILSKAGAFGFLRYCLPLFPHAARDLQSLLLALSLIGMLYAAGLALVQTDIKRIVAYASISHMNLIAFGIFSLNATGFDGSVLQMINHSVIITGLFLIVAYIAARTGTRSLSDMGGLGRHRPVLMWVFLLFVMAGLDLPGLGSFAGEFLVLLGAFRANAWYASVGALTVILAAWYMIRFFQDSMNGPAAASPAEVAVLAEDESKSVYQFPVARHLIGGDLLPREIAVLVPLALLVVYIGIQPDPLTSRFNTTTVPLSSLVHASSRIQAGGP